MSVFIVKNHIFTSINLLAGYKLINRLTIVGKCRTHDLEKYSDGEYPPNITAWSSSFIVREKLEQGRGLDPFTGGENQSPKPKCD